MQNNTAALEKCSDDINVKYGGFLINKNQNMKNIFNSSTFHRHYIKSTTS
jgi:hypothetical protein